MTSNQWDRFGFNARNGDRQKTPIMNRVEPKDGQDASSVLMRIYDPIDSWGGPFGVSAKEFADVLDALPDTVTQIDLHLNSPGGEAFEGMAILNLLRQHPANVTVTVDGLAASAASFIAMAGDDIVMAPNSTMMIHDASGLCYGRAEDMHQLADVLDKLSGNIADVYARRTGGSVDDWRQAMRAESWYTADEAVAAKLADRVLNDEEAGVDPQPSNAWDLKVFAYAGRENAPAPVIPGSSAPQSPGASASGRAAAGGTIPKEVGMSDTLLDGLRQRLGIPADVDADDATLLAALDEALAEGTEEPAKNTDEVAPAALAEITRLSAELADLKQAGAKREKDEMFASWLRDGKTSPAERKELEAMYDAAPAQTVALITARAKGSVVPVDLIGLDDDSETSALDDDYKALFGAPTKVS